MTHDTIFAIDKKLTQIEANTNDIQNTLDEIDHDEIISCLKGLREDVGELKKDLDYMYRNLTEQINNL